jgi:uncharacterized protein (TIGR02594 family)
VTILDIQTALKARGFDPGELDGIWGRRTIGALRAFQRANGLAADGIVGPQTLQALDASAAGTARGAATVLTDGLAPVWVGEARRLMGLQEHAGAGSNPIILDWATDLGLDYASDDIPWCGLFVSHCIGAMLPDEPLPTRPLAARSWLRFGVPCQPALGAVIVFWREAMHGAKGHVGFYDGEDADAYHVLGGNQANRVSVTRISKARFLGTRRPATVSELSGGRVMRSTTGELSNSEA